MTSHAVTSGTIVKTFNVIGGETKLADTLATSLGSLGLVSYFLYFLFNSLYLSFF